jgi:2-methylisocitrate lyase-like PEP mutase family enzyme
LLNVQHTVRGYERAGVSAIQIEDQEFPKKCGHTPYRRVIPTEDMVAKIRVAVASRQDPNFLVIARTDARTGLGFDEALRRGQAYAEAGADVVFVESLQSEDEMRRACAGIRESRAAGAGLSHGNLARAGRLVGERSHRGGHASPQRKRDQCLA